MTTRWFDSPRIVLCVLAPALAAPLAAQEVVLVDQDSSMRYLAPREDPGFGLDWVLPEFSDASWTEGEYGVGYSAGAMIRTAVASGTRVVYTRARFELVDLGAVWTLHLSADFDDGYVAWLNGVEVARASMPAGEPGFDSEAQSHESSNGARASFSPVLDLTDLGRPLLVEGENLLAVGVWNTDAGSSDLALVPFLSINRPPPVSGTELCGRLTEDRRLVVEESPYTATCDVEVPKGIVLTVDPGVEVYFNEDVELRVEGRISALGKAAAPVLLRGNFDARWNGLKIDHAGDGDRRDSTLRDVVLSRGRLLLEVTDTGGSEILVENCSFDRWSAEALSWDRSDGLVVRGCDFGLDTPVGERGHETIHGSRASAIVELCTFGPRTGYNDVMDISSSRWGGPVPTVRYNTFLGGEDDAIDYDQADGWIYGNVIMNHWPQPTSGNANGGGITGEDSRPVIAGNIVYRCFHGIGYKSDSEPLIVNNLILDCNVGITLYQDDCDAPRPRGVLYNNIVWNNRSAETGTPQNFVLNGRWWPGYCQAGEVQSSADVRYSIIEGGWPGEGNLETAPLIADPENGDFSLLPGSPALDAGFGGPFEFAGPDAGELAAVLSRDRTGEPAFDLSCVANSGAGEPAYRDLGPLELRTPDPCRRDVFRRGDCNDDGAVDISDAICILDWLFLGRATPRCVAATNTNGDARPDISDATYLLNHLFLGGSAPVAPFPECGPGTLPVDADRCVTPPESCRL